MACQVPVLGTRSGGVTEVVEDGVTGFLCEVSDTDAMAEKALLILQNDALAREMGRKGRARVEQCFKKDVIVREYEALYDELLAGAPVLVK